MKISKIELGEFSAAARLFPTKLILVGSRLANGGKVESLDMDQNCNVWVNRGQYVIPSAALVYWVPEDGEAEWSARFAEANIIAAASKMAREGRLLTGEISDAVRCPACDKVCASPAGLAAHMRSHKEGG